MSSEMNSHDLRPTSSISVTDLISLSTRQYPRRSSTPPTRNATPHPLGSQSQTSHRLLEVRNPQRTRLDQAKIHSIGFKNGEGGRTGITHPDYDQDHPVVDHEAAEKEHAQEIADAVRKRSELRQKINSGDLVNFRDVIEHQYSFHLRHPENRSLGWRYVLETTEDWVKNVEPWPANLEKRKREGKAGQEKEPKHNRSSISIEEQDQFTPDNWLPRCPDLIRWTGKHPMNAEPPLTRLLDGGLITPNELHYIRNHGPVPRLL
ncbi:hypothetical protein B0T21DRAFT_415992 [Apiosordaria backusii]|uniref:Uncharacterized protein n=1 Tax=Apiosordaria backusii TaxID=314023 RepID=A0AA40A6X5_9PEZI|nr:hypothetical protein B0T21DRAFT_415992 [Apiosordaria backusii]